MASVGTLACEILVALLLLSKPITLGAQVATTPSLDLKPRLQDKNVLEWSVGDVEHWMNNTLGYSEYSSYARKHLVDGPTLLEMEPADFESFFPIENALHVIKFNAHLKLLRGVCVCHNDTTQKGKVVDFWGYMTRHSMRTWTLGTTAMFFPRVAMLGAYLFDHQLYQDLTQGRLWGYGNANAGGEHTTAGGHSRLGKFFFWITFLFVPDLYLAYRCAKLSSLNYFLMPTFVIHFLTQALNEQILLGGVYKGSIRMMHMRIWEYAWRLYSYTLFVPVAGAVVGYVFPVLLQRLCVAALVVHNLLLVIGVVMVLFFSMKAEGATEEGERTRTQSAEERKADASFNSDKPNTSYFTMMNRGKSD